MEFGRDDGGFRLDVVRHRHLGVEEWPLCSS